MRRIGSRVVSWLVVAAVTAMLSPVSMAFAAVLNDEVTSQKLKEADGTSGQNTNSGSGVKTGHIQDGAVTDAKITGPISAGKIQDGVFQKKYGGVIVVAKSGGDFTTIQNAINSISPSAVNPYLIKVMPGTYIENIVLKSYINLIGAGKETTTIQLNVNENAILVSNISNVSISGFTIAGAGGYAGININAASNISVMNNIIKSHSYGIGLINSPNVNISGNTISMNIYDGISFTGNYENSVIESNTITDNSNGISLGGNSSVMIVRANTIQRNSQGGIAGAWASPVIVNNFVTGNNTSQQPWAGDITLGENFTPFVGFNAFDTIGNNGGGMIFKGQFNIKSDGTPIVQ